VEHPSLKGTLPLKAGAYKNIAVIGPNGDDGGVMQGNYQGVAPFLTTPKAALANMGINVTFVKGCSVDGGGGDAGIPAAVAAASAADAVVLVVGLNQGQESEGHDRTVLTFPGLQDQLIERVATAAAGKPVIMVVMSGGMIDISAVKANTNIQSILWAGYPGKYCVYIIYHR
jgi:hypothetical protein